MHFCDWMMLPPLLVLALSRLISGQYNYAPSIETQENYFDQNQMPPFSNAFCK